MHVTIPDLVGQAARRWGDQLAVVDGEARLSYADLHHAAQRFAAALTESGVERGDRVAIWAPNCAGWIVAYLGLSTAGAALVPINTRFKGAEAAEVLTRARARALVTVTDFLGTDYVAALRDSRVSTSPTSRRSSCCTARHPTERSPSPTSSPRRRPRPRASPSTTASTSPTTTSPTSCSHPARRAHPKGSCRPIGARVQVAADWVAMTGLTHGDRYLMVNPYFHMFGLKAGILASITAGATMFPEPVFTVGRVLERVAAEGITVLPGAPTIYQSILDHPARGDHDLSSLRVAVTGAADIPVELIRRMIDELPFRTVIAGYGLTEGGTAAATSPDDSIEIIATTVGRPRPGFELRLVDRDGSDVDPGQPGEILLRSDTVMSHYLDDPAATDEVLSADGWLRTGDLGTLDARGNLRIVGRSKDMFIVGGFNAYPAEIENALLRHPDIQQAAVIGIPDERLGEVGMAFVVLRAGSTASCDDIIAWSRDQMANYKAPRRVEIVDELPLNATGKVVKDELRKRAAS